MRLSEKVQPLLTGVLLGSQGALVRLIRYVYKRGTFPAKFEPIPGRSKSVPDYFAICKYAVAPTSLFISLICDTKESIAAAWTGIQSATDSSSPRPLQASPLSFTSTAA